MRYWGTEPCWEPQFLFVAVRHVTVVPEMIIISSLGNTYFIEIREEKEKKNV
jgi:hypothetical protein